MHVNFFFCPGFYAIFVVTSQLFFSAICYSDEFVAILQALVYTMRLFAS
jgi:hypothetical protein